MSSQSLIGCPHCEKSMCSSEEGDYGRWQVWCGACGSSSGSYKTREEAIAGWNKRACSEIPVNGGESELSQKAHTVKAYFDSPDSYSDEEYAYAVQCANEVWQTLYNAPKRELINPTELAKQHWNYDHHASDGNRAWHHLNEREQSMLIRQMQAAINSIEGGTS